MASLKMARCVIVVQKKNVVKVVKTNVAIHRHVNFNRQLNVPVVRVVKTANRNLKESCAERNMILNVI